MAWTIEYTETARRELKKLDKPAARRILDFLENPVAKQDDPRQLGKALTGPLGTLWLYKIGDYRVMCDIQDELLRVLAVRVGHRRDVYR